MRRRNYAHLELKALRTHLDEHANQDRTYGNSDWIAAIEISAKDKIELNAILHRIKTYSKDCVQNLVRKGMKLGN